MSAHVNEEKYEGCTVKTWERGGSFHMHLRWPDGRWQRSVWEHDAADAGRATAAWILHHGGIPADTTEVG